MSATPDSTLSDSERRIADLERQLAERTAERDAYKAERDEALEQQTATAEVLQVINSSPGDLAPVFDAILEKAHTLCCVECGALQLYDGETFRAVATHGLPEAFAELLRGGYSPLPGSPSEPLVRGEQCVHIVDMAALVAESTPAVAHRLQTSVDLAGTRTLLMVPLRKDNELLGFIGAYRKEVRPFTDKQIALLQNFAAQAVIAMENARLITETHEALEQQTATAEILQVINSSPGDLLPVFDAMLEKAMHLCDANFGSVYARNGEHFDRVASHGLPAEYLAEVPTVAGPFAPGGLFERIIGGENLISIPDLADPEVIRLTPRFEPLVRLAGAHSYVSVALRKDGRLLGMIAIYRREVRPFTDGQIALLQNFAAQAVIAMENARLINETREALEQQTATAEVLGVINSSPGELAPVFEAMLARAHSLCGADNGGLLTYDGERFWPVAFHGLSTQLTDARLEGIDPDVAPSFGRIVRGERLDHIHDMVEFAAQLSDDAFRRRISALVETEGIRTQLIVALRKDDLLLGAIIANRRVMQPFSEKEIGLLENFAAQAVIAMENARLLTETREALEQQTATAEVLQVINSSPGDLTPVFDAILEKAHGLCGAEVGTLAAYDGEYFHALATFGYPEEFAEFVRHPFRPNVSMRRLIEGERVLHFPDQRTLESEPPDAETTRAFLDLTDLRTTLFVALRKDTSLLGYISAHRHGARPFSEKEIALLENFAAQAVIAMENARLLGELHQRTDEVAELNRGLEVRVAEQVEELGRVGRLKRFLAPQLAEMIVSQGDEKILESHRREIVVVFCDLRGYTAFTETAEPEEVLAFLREYHGALGPLVSQYQGTLDQFSGDGIMVFFNDPVPCPDPAERAVKMAMAMREEAGKLIATWRSDGCELGFGAGIAQGYATLGQIGFSERSGYTAIGTVCNLAARLCAEAKDGQILISGRVARAIGAITTLEDLGNLELRGLRRPVAAFNVVQSSAAAARPNLTVVASGPGA